MPLKKYYWPFIIFLHGKLIFYFFIFYFFLKFILKFYFLKLIKKIIKNKFIYLLDYSKSIHCNIYLLGMSIATSIVLAFGRSFGLCCVEWIEDLSALYCFCFGIGIHWQRFVCWRTWLSIAWLHILISCGFREYDRFHEILHRWGGIFYFDDESQIEPQPVSTEPARFKQRTYLSSSKKTNP